MTSTMRLLHYGSRPFDFDADRKYDQNADDLKPVGLWVSIEGGEESYGWRDWCVGEEWNLRGLAHITEITLRPDANILRLASTADIDAFTAQFRRIGAKHRMIDWQRVIALYQGILIAPYQWERRLDHRTNWYYTWDCASGVIWDLSCVGSLKVISAPVAEQINT